MTRRYYAVDLTGHAYDLDVATGKVAHRYALCRNTSPEFTFGGSVLGVVSADGTVAEYEIANDELYAAVTNPATSTIMTVRFDGDGSYVLISDTNGMAYLVDARSKTVVGHFRYPTRLPTPSSPRSAGTRNTVYVPGGSPRPRNCGTG